jgi:hypothetical protein
MTVIYTHKEWLGLGQQVRTFRRDGKEFQLISDSKHEKYWVPGTDYIEYHHPEQIPVTLASLVFGSLILVSAYLHFQNEINIFFQNNIFPITNGLLGIANESINNLKNIGNLGFDAADKFFNCVLINSIENPVCK